MPMGSMMGSTGTWIPALITSIVVVAALAAAGVVAAGIARGRRGGAAGPVVGEQHASPGLTAATPADPLADLRERYARGEISHADFLRDLDAVVRAEQDLVPAARRSAM
ncbi:MAG: SHOCT domain-containing protein [Actinomycetota bacterium]|nr:SHOCT domain-containing protein [Actinomycetota bacterium]